MSIEAMKQEQVVVRYWVQDTMESGRWIETGPMPRRIAENAIANNLYDRGQIITPKPSLHGCD